MSKLAAVLVLSFKKRNLELLTQVMEKAHYQVIAASNYLELEQVLLNSTEVALGLIDLSGCDRRIWNYCEQLGSKNISFLVFTPQYNATIEQHSLTHGASKVLVKPLVIKNLLSLINSLVGKSA